MLDPRIYRMGIVPVVLAVLVLAFSLENQPAALGTSLAPDAYSPSQAYAAMLSLARSYPRRAPGSIADGELAGYVASQLRQDRFSVSSDQFSADTVHGRRLLENVVGTWAGQGNGTIVVLADRDGQGSPSKAALSSTAVLLELGHLLSGETLRHTIALASISGSTGAVGAARLAQRIPKPVDAVIVLGDLAGTEAREPVLVPWSDSTVLAPPLLRNTIAAALGAQAGISAGGSGLGGQIAHLAFPMASSEQAVFGGAGDPAILLSLSSQQGPAAGEPVSIGRIGSMGRALLESLHALDAGPALQPPSTYLIWSGKLVPAWAIRLLVLALLIPVLATTIDGVARARRRGHSILRWIVWALATGAPFVLGAVVVGLAQLVGLISFAPAIPVGGGAVSPGAGGIAVLVLVLMAIAAGFALLRPMLLSMAGTGRQARDPEGDRAGPAAGLLAVLCVVSLVIWWVNPFAAILVVPALHLWLWLLAPGARVRTPIAVVAVLGGLALPVLVGVYYAITLGLGPIGLAWSWVLLLAGGGVSWTVAVEWALLAGCAVGVVLVAIGSVRQPAPEPAAVTIRGPVTYAGPGSLGGTKSALRR